MTADIYGENRAPNGFYVRIIQKKIVDALIGRSFYAESMNPQR